MRAPAAASELVVMIIGVGKQPPRACVAWMLPSRRMVALWSAPRFEGPGRGWGICQLEADAPTEAAIPLMIPLSSLSELSRVSIRAEVVFSSLVTDPIIAWIAAELSASS